jgi:hypothetical protein
MEYQNGQPVLRRASARASCSNPQTNFQTSRYTTWAGAKGADAICAIRDGLIAEHLGVSIDRVSDLIDTNGSLIETIEALRGRGRTLRPYKIPDVTAVEKWLADNEVLDPESPSEMFEATTHRGLFRRLWRRHP